MKYFGEYLVSKGIISEDVLTDTLIEQTVSLPAAMEVVRAKQLIRSGDFLRVFSRQSEQRIEFKHACLELGLWTSEMEEIVKKELEAKRVPLGQLLVKRGVVELQAITKALDEFLSGVEVPVPVAASKENQAIDPILLEELMRYLTDDRLQNVAKLFQAAVADAKVNNFEKTLDGLKLLFTEFRSLRGILRFIQLERSEALVSLLEGAVFLTIEQVTKSDAHLVTELASVGLLGVEILGGLKGFLVQCQSEAPMLQDANWSARIEEFSKKTGSILEREK